MAAFHVACRFTLKPVCTCTDGAPAHVRNPADASSFAASAKKLWELWKDPSGITGVPAGVDVALPASKGKKRRAKEFQSIKKAKKALGGGEDGKVGGAVELDAKRAAKSAATLRAQVQMAAAKAAKLCVEAKLGYDESGIVGQIAAENGVVNEFNAKPFDIDKDVEIVEGMKSQAVGMAIPGATCAHCRSDDNSSKMMSCATCSISYHKDCLDPPLKRVPRDGWACPECVFCHSCKAIKAGSGVSGRWGFGFTMCDSCSRLFTKGAYCPCCLVVYRDNEPRPMIECDACESWVHTDCDEAVTDAFLDELEMDEDKKYSCKVCRGEAKRVPGPEEVGAMIREIWANNGDPSGGRKRKGKKPKPKGGPKPAAAPPITPGGGGGTGGGGGGSGKKTGGSGGEKRKLEVVTTPGGEGGGGWGKKARPAESPTVKAPSPIPQANVHKKRSARPHPPPGGGGGGGPEHDEESLMALAHQGGAKPPHVGGPEVPPPTAPGLVGCGQVMPADLARGTKRPILVYWPGDGVWYAGVVTATRADRGVVSVLYDMDGEREDLSIYPDDSGTLLSWAKKA